MQFLKEYVQIQMFIHIELQLILEQHMVEQCGYTYTWVFFQ